MSNGRRIEIQELTMVSTDEIIYDLITCWDEYLAHKDCDKGCPNEIDEMMPLILEAAAARLLTYIRNIRFVTVGLITTNVVWILNTLGTFQ